MHFIWFALAFAATFAAGVYLSPALWGDYGKFKAWTAAEEARLRQAAKDKLLKII